MNSINRILVHPIDEKSGIAHIVPRLATRKSSNMIHALPVKVDPKKSKSLVQKIRCLFCCCSVGSRSENSRVQSRVTSIFISQVYTSTTFTHQLSTSEAILTFPLNKKNLKNMVHAGGAEYTAILRRAEREYFGENITFLYDALQLIDKLNLMKSNSSTISVNDTNYLFKDIFKTYISNDADTQVNLSDNIKGILLNANNSNINIEEKLKALEKAVEEILMLVHYSINHRWKN